MPPLCTRRRAIVIPAALVGLALVVITAIAVADPRWVREAGLDIWNQFALQRNIQEGTELNRDLTDQHEEIFRRIEVKEVLTGQLIAGQATLAATTRQFLALDQDRTNYMDVLRRYQAGATDEEKMARNVIQYALRRETNATDNERLAHRLESEFRAMFPSATEPAIWTAPTAPPVHYRPRTRFTARNGAK